MTTIFDIEASPAPRWACILEGDATDLTTARRKFGRGGDFSIEEIDLPSGEQATALLSPKFDAAASSVEVYSQAVKIVIVVAGILFSMDYNTRPLEIKSIRERNADGVWGGAQFFVGAGEIHWRGAGSLTETLDALNPDPLLGKFASLADADDVVMDVLHRISRSPDWFDLYAAYERMKCDINERLDKQKATTEIGWPSERRQTFFRESSNVYRHSKAKWGRYSPANAMPIRDARQFVSDCLRIWLLWRAL